MSEAVKRAKSYIDARIRGTFSIQAMDRYEAVDKAVERIMEKFWEEHGKSFGQSGLTKEWWREWIEEKMIGVEAEETDEEVIESLDVSWTNIKKKTRSEHLEKGGQIKL